jgi:hypothetical protein
MNMLAVSEIVEDSSSLEDPFNREQNRAAYAKRNYEEFEIL